MLSSVQVPNSNYNLLQTATN